MENLLVKIRESYQDFGDRDQRIATFVLKNEGDIPRLSIKQVADGTGTSPAAVVRFCKLFGMKGFKDFRRQLTVDILSQVVDSLPLAAYKTTDLQENEDVDSITERITLNNIRAISETESLLDRNWLKYAIDLLANASRIDFFGAGASSIVALDAHQKFIRIGKICNANQDSHIQLTLASSMRPGDVAVVISYSGRSKDVLETATVAKERGATLIVLTKYGNKNPLAEIADVVLNTTSPEAAFRSGATGSRIAQLTVIDILFAGTASRDIAAYQKNLENTYFYAAIKKLR